MLQSGWLFNGESISTILVLSGDSNVDEVISLYQNFIAQWRTLKHPALFKILDLEITKENKQQLKITLILEGSVLFKPLDEILQSTPRLECFFFIKQGISFFDYCQQQGMQVDCSQALVHPCGVVCWLPPLPDWLLVARQQQLIAHRQYTTQWLLKLLGCEVTLETVSEVVEYCDEMDWQDVEAKTGLAWEWVIFIKHYSQLSTSNLLVEFSFIFYQAWLYITANRLVMKDKVINKQDFELFMKFANRLGINEGDIERLTILSQQRVLKEALLLNGIP